MSFDGSTAVIADEHPWVQAAPQPSPAERRRGLLAPAPEAAPAHRPKLFYAAVAVAAVVLIVSAQLGLSILVTGGAYRVTALQGEQTKLSRSYQAASEAADKLSSPQNLAANADALGMVANSSPVYLRLSDGTVIGAPAQASASAGTVTGSGTQQVPNALTDGIPLVTAKTGQTPSESVTDPAPKAPSQGTQKNGESGTPASNAPAAPTGPVAWSGLLPSPDTH